jgi:hypothetical protein
MQLVITMQWLGRAAVKRPGEPTLQGAANAVQQATTTMSKMRSRMYVAVSNMGMHAGKRTRDVVHQAKCLL